VTDDTENDALAAFAVGEAGHGPRASPHFTKGAFDDVGGAYFLPVRFGNGEEMQQGVQIAFHASHCLGAAVFPMLLPVAKRAPRCAAGSNRATSSTLCRWENFSPRCAANPPLQSK